MRPRIREGRRYGLAEAPSVSDPRRTIVAFNPAAGPRAAYEALRRTTTRFDGTIVATIETSLDGAFAARMRDAVRQVWASTGGPPTIIAVGGDGTFSMTLNALADPRDALLALIPAGSGNDFAVALGIPDVGAAIDAVESGAARDVDFGVVNGRRFANCVGMGLDAEVGALAARMRARGFPAKASYYGAALAGLFMVKPVRLDVEADGAAARYKRGVMVTVGNGEWYGGGFRGAPHAVIDDGLLDTYVFTDIEGVPARLALMRRIKAGTHTGRNNVTGLRSSTVRVSFERPVAMHVDGEIRTVQEAEISVVPRGMRVIAASGVTSPAATRGGSDRAS